MTIEEFKQSEFCNNEGSLLMPDLFYDFKMNADVKKIKGTLGIRKNIKHIFMMTDKHPEYKNIPNRICFYKSPDNMGDGAYWTKTYGNKMILVGEKHPVGDAIFVLKDDDDEDEVKKNKTTKTKKEKLIEVLSDDE
jgi:hypothetical protein